MDRKLLVILIFFISKFSYSQNLEGTDTLNILKEVSVTTDRALHLTGLKILQIDSLIISQKSNENLSELLSENSSIFIKYQGKGALATASFRGTNASHTKVSWNNINLNSPLLGMVDLSQVPMSVTDEVTVFCGSSSISRNNNAIGGLIELKTQPEWKEGLRAKIQSSVGSFYSFDNFLEIKLGNKKIQSSSKIYCNSAKNNFPFYNYDVSEPKKEYRQNADYHKKGLEQDLFFRINNKNIISAKIWYQNSDRGVPSLTTNESGINNNVNREYFNSVLYSTQYLNIKEKSSFEINHGVNFQTSNYNSQTLINGVGFLKTVDSEAKSFSTYNSANYKFNLNKNSEFLTKISFNSFKVNSDEQIRIQHYDTIRYEGGLFISYFTKIVKKFNLGAVVKQDFYDKKLCPFVPAIFAEYAISDKTLLKSSFAKNYNLPSLNDLYYVPGGNPKLLPEKGMSIDFGLQTGNSEITLNYGNINDWIMWRPTAMGYWTPNNIEKVVTYGLEYNLHFEVKVSKFIIKSNANYAYTISKNKSQPINENDNSINKQLPYIPKHSANLFTQIKFKEYYLYYQWNFYSKRYTTSAAEQGILTEIYPYFMSNLAVGRSFNYKQVSMDLKFNVYNLLNEKYRSVLWQPMPRINYSIQLILKF